MRRDAYQERWQVPCPERAEGAIAGAAVTVAGAQRSEKEDMRAAQSVGIHDLPAGTPRL